MVFAGVGLVALPVDCIREFFGRPHSTITKSEYIKRAKGLGERAHAVKVGHHCRPSQGPGRAVRIWDCHIICSAAVPGCNDWSNCS